MPETILRAGQHLARFRIERRLGRGGMGEVYLAFDLEARAPRALKFLPPEFVQEPEAIGRLAHEARLARTLEHPHIVKIFGLENAEGLDFIVMEFVDGETLEEKLESGPMDAGSVCRLGMEVTSALAAAHAIGLIHRDIKPSNLMLEATSAVKVLDFGLAKRFGTMGGADIEPAATATRFTRTGMIVGTAAYMSPEQTRGEPLDGRSDLFSLGTVLYEAATGLRPFRGASALEVMHEIAMVDPLPAGLIRPELPIALDGLLSRALRKDPRERYQSAEDLATALSEIQRTAPSPRARGGSAQVSRPRGTAGLPAAPTSFVGRTRERAELRSELANHRIVTITGPAGSGKTRLAIEVASDLEGTIAEGAWFVDLSTVLDRELVGPSIASALGAREGAGDDPMRSVLAFLKPRSLLLVLDNCEHVRAACAAWVASVVRATPRIRILATSRELLGVEGERAWAIPALSIPSFQEASAARPAELLRSEAVRLFVERARAAHPVFEMGPENAALVAEICHQLDGLPLAIELCAARVRVMPLQEIRRRLEDRFRFLAVGDDSLPERQRTLLAAMDWSHELLSEPERALFRSLGVFTGGASLDAIEDVCPGTEVSRERIVDLLTSLSQKSLVVAGEGAGGLPRYRLLETLRQYARDRLHERGEEAVLLERHARNVEQLAHRAGCALEGLEQAVWLERLDEEHGNIRAVMDWLLERGELERLLRIAGSIGGFWWVRGHWREGLRRLEQLLSANTGDGDPLVRARALDSAGRLCRERGDYRMARRRYEESRKLYEASGDTLALSMALANLGITAQAEGDFERARYYFERSLELQRQIGDLRSIAISYNNLGRLAGELGDADASWRYFEQGLELRREVGDPRGVALSLLGMGNAALRQGNPSVARTHFLQSLAIQREIGHRQGSAHSLASLGLAALTSGDRLAARAYLAEALSTVREIGDNIGLAEVLDRFAELAADVGQPERAMRVHGAASAIYEALGTPRGTTDARRINALKEAAIAAIGRDRAASAAAEGQAMGLEHAIALALESM